MPGITQSSFPPVWPNSRRGNVLLELNWPNNWLAYCFSLPVNEMEPLQSYTILESEKALKIVSPKLSLNLKRDSKKWSHSPPMLSPLPCLADLLICEGNQSLTNLKLLLGDIDFKPFIKKQKTQKKPLAIPHFLPKRYRRKNLLQEGDLRILTLAWVAEFELSLVNRRVSSGGGGFSPRYPLCPTVSQLLLKNLPAMPALYVLASSTPCESPILTSEI